jgi:DNA-binding SARP family transcriptional activator
LASLHNYLSRLRKTLGAERLRLEPGGYVLRVDAERFDLARFGRLVAEAQGAPPRERADLLRAALALWSGPPLAEFAFDEFAQLEIARLEDLRLAATKDCIDAELALGHHDHLFPELESLVQEHPFDERLHGQMMLCLYRGGRQLDAIYSKVSNCTTLGTSAKRFGNGASASTATGGVTPRTRYTHSACAALTTSDKHPQDSLRNTRALQP